MANTILITANWHTGALSQQTISRQYDNNRYAVRFVGYPEASDGNELDYYLLVWMSTAPGQKPGEITPIQLNSDQWYISNYFTQQVQVIKFQLCVLNEAGTYEAHSPIFSGRIGDSLEHDGTSQDIDVSTLFDAYREYVEELIIGAGAMIIDPAPTQGSTNAVSSGGVWNSTLNVYSYRINADNYQTYGITDIISMPTNKYAVFYTYPDNAKRITSEMVANLPSYNHAYVCVLKISPSTSINAFSSYIAWGFTSANGLEAVYVANGKNDTSNTPWVKIWDASVNADSIAQKLDIANTSNVVLSFPERINKTNFATYGISSAITIPANRYITFSTNPGLSTAITESDVSGLPSYNHNFLTILKLAPVSNPYASYIAWGFSTANGIETVYTANGLGSTSNTPWVRLWDKDNNLDGHFKSNKKVSIIGDSISTFTDYVPSGYATYYPRQDVTSVDNLWWKIALNKTGMSLLKNASWASSSVAGDDTSGAVVASSDARIADLADGDTKPDIVIVLIGTNDFGRSYSIGTFTDTDTIPTASNIADFKPAYAKMIGKIHSAYPEAKVFVCTLIPRTFSGGGYPAKDQNNDSLYAFNRAIKDVAEMMNCSVIDINMNSGINVNNLPNHFIQETSGSYIHPLASGQSLVGECVARELIKGVTL